MKKITRWLVICSVFLLITIPSVNAEFSYYIQVNYENGELNYQDLNVIDGKSPDHLNEPENEYNAVILDFHDKEISKANFGIPLKIYDLPGNFLLNKTTKILILPFHNTGKFLNIISPKNELKLQIDLSSLAMCNQNYICEPKKENHETCPIDCISGGKDNLCEYSIDGVCDPDCESKDFECNYDITEKKMINDLISIYEKEIITYKGILEAKQQITVREERINNLKSNNLAVFIGFLIILLILTLLIALILKKRKK